MHASTYSYGRSQTGRLHRRLRSPSGPRAAFLDPANGLFRRWKLFDAPMRPLALGLVSWTRAVGGSDSLLEAVKGVIVTRRCVVSLLLLRWKSRRDILWARVPAFIYAPVPPLHNLGAKTTDHGRSPLRNAYLDFRKSQNFIHLARDATEVFLWHRRSSSSTFTSTHVAAGPQLPISITNRDRTAVHRWQNNSCRRFLLVDQSGKALCSSPSLVSPNRAFRTEWLRLSEDAHIHCPTRV